MVILRHIFHLHLWIHLYTNTCKSNKKLFHHRWKENDSNKFLVWVFWSSTWTQAAGNAGKKWENLQAVCILTGLTFPFYFFSSFSFFFSWRFEITRTHYSAFLASVKFLVSWVLSLQSRERKQLHFLEEKKLCFAYIVWVIISPGAPNTLKPSVWEHKKLTDRSKQCPLFQKWKHGLHRIYRS